MTQDNNANKLTGKTHELKTWPEYFQAIKSGKKNFEIRKNDRDYHVGDCLLLREWEPKGYSSVNPNERVGDYTGEELAMKIDYILNPPAHVAVNFGLMGNSIIMSISPLANKPTDNAGQVTAEQFTKEVSPGDFGFRATLQEMDRLRFVHNWMERFATLVAEERCREKDIQLGEISLNWHNSMSEVRKLQDEICNLEKTIAWKDQQLEIRDKQLEEVKFKADKMFVAIHWALGYTDFYRLIDDDRPYWWRPKLRELSGLTDEELTAHQEQKQGGNNE